MGLEFEAVEARWIVAGRDHHAANGALGSHGKGDGGRGGGFTGEDDLEAVAGQNLGGAQAEFIGGEAAVEADDRFAGGAFRGFEDQKSAAAWATRSTLAKVKSSAITARQPSVPNFMGALDVLDT